jgi:hypothetical protein
MTALAGHQAGVTRHTPETDQTLYLPEASPKPLRHNSLTELPGRDLPANEGRIPLLHTHR